MTLHPEHLLCEDLHDPLGIGVARPRLAWRSSSAVRGAVQAAWQIQAAATAEALAEGHGVLWDSGWVAGDEAGQIAWGGAELSSHQQVAWRVRLRDGQGGEGPWSAPARFGVGCLQAADWSAARWIRSPRAAGTAVSLLRRELDLPTAPRRALLYLTARGVVRAHLDGRRIGDDEFAPGWCDYRQRIPYRCHDVTALLGAGTHALTAYLGDGWFRGAIGWAHQSHQYGSNCELLALLRIEHIDGSIETIATGQGWTCRDSHIQASSFLDGEHIDLPLRRAQDLLPGCQAKDWESVILGGDGAVTRLQSHPAPPVRTVAVLAPVAISAQGPGRWLIDFGQNLAGRVRIRPRLPAGRVLRLRHAEILDADGGLYVANLRSAVAMDVIVADGGAEWVEPLFTFHGFRYCEISGLDRALEREDVCAAVLSTDCTTVGGFACDRPDLERLFQNIIWTQRANFIEVPTDCPQRDERMGWTGDAQVFLPTAALTSDVAGFFRHWLRCLNEAQGKNGQFPNIAPLICKELAPFLAKGDAAWADAGAVCPLELWQQYGDRALLMECWPHLRAWAEWLLADAGPALTRRFDPQRHCCFGDWLNIQAETGKDLVMSAHLTYVIGVAEEAAAILGNAQERQRYAGLRRESAAAFRARFVHADGRVAEGDAPTTQTACLMALAWDLLVPAQVPAVLARLVADIRERGTRLSTGFVGLPLLLPTLSRHGQAELAGELLVQDQFPSWLYEVRNGATTVWERWDGWTEARGFQDTNMNSFSHYAYGAVGRWMVEHLGGLRPVEPGWRRAVIAPEPVGGLQRVAVHHDSRRGRYAVAWRREGSSLHLEVVIPANGGAELRVPCADLKGLRVDDATVPGARQEGGHAVFTLGSGTYRIATALS